jgi:hypothetical protein
MNTYRTIKAKMLSKLQAISTIQEVYDYPKLDFAGFPAAVIIPIEGEGDYETNQEHTRNYIYEVHLYQEYSHKNQSDALNVLMDVTDDILDSFAGDEMLSGITMPAKTMLIGVRPLWAGWDEVSDKSLIHATIKVNAYVSVDNT